MYMYSKKEKKIMQTKVCYLIEYFPYIGLCLHNWLPKQVSGMGLPSLQLKKNRWIFAVTFLFQTYTLNRNINFGSLESNCSM